MVIGGREGKVSLETTRTAALPFDVARAPGPDFTLVFYVHNIILNSKFPLIMVFEQAYTSISVLKRNKRFSDVRCTRK